MEQMYHIMTLQDYLAEYALRLTQATLEQESTVYHDRTVWLERLPVLYLALLAVALVLVLVLLQVLSSTVVRPLLQLAQASRSIAENDFSGADLPVRSQDDTQDRKSVV